MMKNMIFARFFSKEIFFYLTLFYPETILCGNKCSMMPLSVQRPLI